MFWLTPLKWVAITEHTSQTLHKHGSRQTCRFSISAAGLHVHMDPLPPLQFTNRCYKILLYSISWSVKPSVLSWVASRMILNHLNLERPAQLLQFCLFQMSSPSQLTCMLKKQMTSQRVKRRRIWERGEKEEVCEEVSAQWTLLFCPFRAAILSMTELSAPVEAVSLWYLLGVKLEMCRTHKDKKNS